MPASPNGVGAYVHTARADDRADDPNVPWVWPHAPPAGGAQEDEGSRDKDEFYMRPLVESADCATFLPSGEVQYFEESRYRLVRICS